MAVDQLIVWERDSMGGEAEKSNKVGTRGIVPSAAAGPPEEDEAASV